MTTSWKEVSVREALESLDSRRRPVKSADRQPGPYPYWGASGVVDYVDGFLFDEPTLLVSEDGENLRTRKTPIAFYVTGKYWVNNHAHVFRARDGHDLRFHAYQFQTLDVAGYLTGSTQPKLTAAAVQSMKLSAPPLDEQRRIAEALGALDDLIDTNERLADAQTELATAHGQRLLSRLSEGEVGTIDDIATIVKGYSYKSAELVEGGGWLVGLKNVGRRGEFRADGFKPLNAEVKPSQVVDNGDLVVAHTDLTQAREVIGRPVRVRRGKRDGTLVASLDLAVVRPKQGVSVEYLQAVLESATFREHALGYCNGTTVLHMSSQAVPSFPITVPTADYLRAFDELATLRAGADDAYDAADELRRTRDELLPLLMSGAVRVRPEGVAA